MGCIITHVAMGTGASAIMPIQRELISVQDFDKRRVNEQKRNRMEFFRLLPHFQTGGRDIRYSFADILIIIYLHGNWK